jgi:hypothetical protein
MIIKFFRSFDKNEEQHLVDNHYVEMKDFNNDSTHFDYLHPNFSVE